MKKDLQFEFSVEKENKLIRVTREFAAPVENVWAAWTESALLDQWWAPRPYKTQTRSMDFRKGGFWLYAMEGPTGDRHWCRADYLEVETGRLFSHSDAFCDENGVPNGIHPGSRWVTRFESSGEHTIVRIDINYNSPEDLQKIIEMGFKEGFSMAIGNLDELLAS